MPERATRAAGMSQMPLHAREIVESTIYVRRYGSTYTSSSFASPPTAVKRNDAVVVPVAERIESVFVRNTIVGVGCHEPLGATVPTGIVRPAATTETTTVPRLGARERAQRRRAEVDADRRRGGRRATRQRERRAARQEAVPAGRHRRATGQRPAGSAALEGPARSREVGRRVVPRRERLGEHATRARGRLAGQERDRGEQAAEASRAGSGRNDRAEREQPQSAGGARSAWSSGIRSTSMSGHRGAIT